MRMSAPMRFISERCMNRCGKMFSVTVLMPGLVASSAHICACMSVGKPGYGSVVSSRDFAPPLGRMVTVVCVVFVRGNPPRVSRSATQVQMLGDDVA